MTTSNLFEVLTMNDPLPEVVLQNCFDAINVIDDIDCDEVDVVWTSPKMSCEFTHNNVKVEIFYNKDADQTEVKMSVSDEIYQKHIADLRQYPQYKNKTDRECWPQSYHITKVEELTSEALSLTYEDIANNNI